MPKLKSSVAVGFNWEKLYKQERPEALRREHRGKAGYGSGIQMHLMGMKYSARIWS